MMSIDLENREKVIKEWESVLSRDPLDVPWDLIDDTLTLLKEQEPPTIDELKVHYGETYKCKGCGLEWYQQAQRYCQHCGRPVKFK